jgi:hypothetical protein
MGLSARLDAKLKEIAARIGNGSVSVGFLAGATYPDGQSVATVAFWNEFGTKGRAHGDAPHPDAVAEGIRSEPQLSGGLPPRPFFRRMVAAESGAWGTNLGKAVVASKGDGNRALGLMGEEIKGELQQSINLLTSPPLKPSTIKRKGFAKPLIDTGDMLRSVDYRVDG